MSRALFVAVGSVVFAAVGWQVLSTLACGAAFGILAEGLCHDVRYDGRLERPNLEVER